MIESKAAELEAKLKAAKDGTPEQVDAMLDLAWEVSGVDMARGRELSNNALELAKSIGYGRGIAYGKRNIGMHLFGSSDLELALTTFKEALSWFEENDDFSGQADIAIGLAYLHWGFGDFQRGFDEAFKALDLYGRVGNDDGRGWAMAALGGFYHDWNDHKQSREYYEKARELFEKSDNPNGLGRALNGIGNAHHLLGEYEKALEYQENSLEIHEAAKDEFGATKTLNDIGLILQSMGKHDEALDYHYKSLEIRKRVNYLIGQSTCLLDLGNVYIYKREYDKALEMLDKALVVSQKIRSKPKMGRAHLLLSNLYRDLQQFDTALVHFENYHRIQEEVFNEDSETKLENMRSTNRIEASEKEAEIHRLKNVELKEKNDQLEETLTLLQGAQAQIVQAGKMAALGGLVAGLAHEINNPVGTIRSGADVNSRVIGRALNMLETGDGSGANREALEDVLKIVRLNAENAIEGTERIERIIKSLQSFSRLDEADFQRGNIHDGLESTLTLIAPEIKDGVKVVKNYGTVPNVYMYPGELNQVFMNILLNAAQAVKEKGTITITTTSGDGHIRIEISDDGKGIPRDKLDTLFEPGFTKKHSTVRMRTGLYTSYNIVHKHKGDIRVESERDKGTTFIITISDNLDDVVQRRTS